MPRRYGTYEPPQYKYSETGRDHLISFLEEGLLRQIVWKDDEARITYSYDCPIWYATKPISFIFFSDAYLHEKHIHKNLIGDQYRCNCIELRMLKDAYNQPNWRFAVRRLFREVALLYMPFYAEIIDESDKGICSWWWRGIPAKRGEPIIIGNPYSSLFQPKLSSSECLADGLFYLEEPSLLRIPGKYLSKRLKSTNTKHRAPCEVYSVARALPIQIKKSRQGEAGQDRVYPR